MSPGESRTLEVAVHGGALAVECAGAGTPLVLLHGWALDRRVWHAQMALADRFRLVAIDRRGFGRSTAPPDLNREVADLVAVRDALGLDRMVLVGMSQGGRVALHHALGHPESVAAIVLQGAPLDGFLPTPRREDAIPLASFVALARQARLDRMKALWRAHPLMRAGTAEAQQRIDAMLADYEGRDLVAAAPHELAAIADDLGAIHAPALVVTGEQDTPWRQLVGDALAYGMPHSRRATIAGAGHLCNLSHPAEFNALLADFAASIGG